MEQKSIQGTVIRASIFILLIMAAFVVKPIVLGNAQNVSLTKAPALSGQISQAFAGQASNTLPVIGTDYKIYNATYFDNDTWVVVQVQWLTREGNDAIVLLQKQHGVYNTMLGPGTEFPTTVSESLPSDVALYLKRLGALYDPAE